MPSDLADVTDAQSLQKWVALGFLVLAWFVFDPVERAINHPLAAALNLPLLVKGEMSLGHYAELMVVRLLLDCVVVGGVLGLLDQRWRGFPLAGRGALRLALLGIGIGIGIGIVVMTGAIIAILAMGSAWAAFSVQSGGAAFAHGAGWLAADFVGATGEELYGRVAVLLVAERFVGWRGAIVVSGLMFSVLHLGNPGASWIWLLRLGVQGALLAYAVYRTGSVWWSCGYHTGWNWASAPLFGAAGSGYFDQGHLLTFQPTGSVWITGGPVGPEGSVFAFVAVVCAFGLLCAMTPGRRARR
jgi:membrane protease YdiL (CAAX protease family)